MKRLSVLVAGLILVAAGCASTTPPSGSASASTQPHAECLVCKHNADLACVDVSVDAGTPRCVCNGQTYYFCSEQCKQAFEKNPAKYLSHGK